MDAAFLREAMLLGPEALERLAGCHVMVLGIGGVGSYCAEALARAGIGRLTFVDDDVVSPTNLNRQLVALRSTVGRPKAEVMAERALDINPACDVRAVRVRYGAETAGQFFDGTRYDFVVDAIDLMSCKLHLIQSCHRLSIPCLSACGTGNKLDASRFRITDLSETFGCPMARVLRRELKARGILHHPVLFSDEAPRTPLPLEAPPPGRRSLPASVSWVPPAAGLMMAGYVVQRLIAE